MEKPFGRPTIFTQEIADAILEQLASGKSLRGICLADDMPSIATVIRWLSDERFEDFQAQYARAREVQADTLVDEIIHIADNPIEGTKTKSGPNGTEITTGDMIEHRKLQVDARKWFASKMRPGKYGDKQTIRHEGETLEQMIAGAQKILADETKP